MERMPCDQKSANAAFFRLGVIAHNLFMLFKACALGEGWQWHRVATVRWRLFQIPCRLNRHAGTRVLKLPAVVAACSSIFATQLRRRLRLLGIKPSPIRNTSRIALRRGIPVKAKTTLRPGIWQTCFYLLD